MAVYFRKAGIQLTLLLYFSLGTFVFAQTPAERLDTLRIIAVNPPVSISRNGEEIAVKDWGLALSDLDEITTGPGGKAYIFLSLLSQGNEIFMASSTRVRVSKTPMTEDRIVHYVEVIYGKIRANVQLTPNQEIRISTLSSEIISNDGEFIVEQNRGNTQIGTSKGLVQMFSKSNNQGEVIPENTTATVFQGTDTVKTGTMSKRLKRGLSTGKDEEFEADADMSQIRRQAAKRKKEIELTLARAEKKRQEEERAARQAAQEAQRAKEERERVLAEEGARAAKKAELEAKAAAETVAKETAANEQLMAEQEEEPVSEPLDAVEEHSLFMKYKWHIAATSTFLVFAYLATDEASQYNSLDSENSSLQSQYASATTSSARTVLEVQYEVNKEKMAQHKSNVDLYNYFSIIALSAEAYLLYLYFFSDDDPAPGNSAYNHHRLMPDAVSLTTNFEAMNPDLRLFVSWKW